MIYFYIFGAGAVGANLAKETARFISCLSGEKPGIRIIDNGIVKEEDLFYLPLSACDIGFSRAGAVAGALADVFGSLNIKAYNVDACEYEPEKERCIPVIINTIPGNASGAARKLFNQSQQAVLIDAVECSQGRGFLYLTSKIGNFVFGDVPTVTEPVFTGRNRLISGTFVADMILAVAAMTVTGGKTGSYKHYLDVDTFCSREEYFSQDLKLYEYNNRPSVILCVGAGGTGSAFLKEFARLVSGRDNVSLYICDGDYVEEKNLERQAFSENDLLQNKALALTQSIKDEFDVNVTAIPRYIKSVSELAGTSIFEESDFYLIGCVDNHRARQVMEEMFELIPNITYIDSGNEFSDGEVVVGIKRNGIILSPSRAYFYPEVLTDTGKAADELSCGEINESSPQHQATNLAAGQIILNVMDRAMSGDIPAGIIHFDAFRLFSRIQQYDYTPEGGLGYAG